MHARGAQRPSVRLVLAIVVLLGLLGAVGGYLVYAINQPKVDSYGLVLLRPPAGGDPDRFVADQLIIMTSDGVLSDASARTGMPVSTVRASVSVSQRRLSNVVEVSAVADSSSQAQQLVAGVIQGYVSDQLVMQSAQGQKPALLLQSPSGGVAAGPALRLTVPIGVLVGLLLSYLLWLLRVRSFAIFSDKKGVPLTRAPSLDTVESY